MGYEPVGLSWKQHLIFGLLWLLLGPVTWVLDVARRLVAGRAVRTGAPSPSHAARGTARVQIQTPDDAELVWVRRTDGLEPDVILVMIPGNPGLGSLYTPFLARLVTLAGGRLSCVVVSHLGEDPVCFLFFCQLASHHRERLGDGACTKEVDSTNRSSNHSSSFFLLLLCLPGHCLSSCRCDGRLFSLNDQIEHKIHLMNRLMGEHSRARFILAGTRCRTIGRLFARMNFLVLESPFIPLVRRTFDRCVHSHSAASPHPPRACLARSSTVPDAPSHWFARLFEAES